LLIVLSAGCGSDSGAVLFESDDLRITSVGVWSANVFIVDRNGKRLMIDAANPGDEEEIEKRMRSQGIDPASIDYLILTHGHLDHGGTAAYFQKTYGIEVIGGEGDAPMTLRGGLDDVCPTSTLAKLILWMGSGRTYPSFEIDIPVADDFDLASLGIGGRILHWPGHTPGSVLIAFDDQVFVGDLIRGGILAPETPATHFFMCDLADNREKIRRLVEMPEFERWYPGHFGPLTPQSVREYLEPLAAG
jgi:glyoxylase-like metal-dependent hydrolase (beta-lactamase superfamily II)